MLGYLLLRHRLAKQETTIISPRSPIFQYTACDNRLDTLQLTPDFHSSGNNICCACFMECTSHMHQDSRVFFGWAKNGMKMK